MSVGEIITWLLYLVAFPLFSFVAGCLLLWNARRKAVVDARWLGAFFLFSGGYYLAQALELLDLVDAPSTVFVSLFMAGFFSFIRFVNKVFHPKGTAARTYQILLACHLAITMVVLVLSIAEDLDATGSFPVTQFYVVRNVLGAVVFVPVVQAWAIVSAVNAYVRLDAGPLRVALRRRFITFCLSSIMPVVMGLVHTTLTFDERLFNSYAHLTAIIAIFYVIINVYTWFVPVRSLVTVPRLGLATPVAPPPAGGPAVDLQGPERAGQTFSRAGILNVVDYIGERLAESIKKPPAACKGLLMMLLSGWSPDKEYVLSLDELHAVLAHDLPRHLALLGIEDAIAIANDLASHLRRNPSLHAMFML